MRVNIVYRMMRLYVNGILRAWRTSRDDFGFLDWNIYFQKGCYYSNEANEMM